MTDDADKNKTELSSEPENLVIKFHTGQQDYKCQAEMKNNSRCNQPICCKFKKISKLLPYNVQTS